MLVKKNGTLEKLSELGDIHDEDCEVEVKYYDEDDITILQLYKESKEDVIYLDA